MRILGIESSCDETAAAVVEDGRNILSNIIVSQIDIHKLYGGVVPEIAGRNHIEAIDLVVAEALKQAKVELCDIDAIAVTYGAGLVGALLVGVCYAKALAQASNIPLYAVNHIEGHICANYITNKDLTPPYICVLASGGHTAITKVNGYNDITVLCSTIDDAVGEAFDKVARVMGLSYPGGVKIDALSKNGQALYPFHTVVVDNGNFSYSGLKTGVINFLHNETQKGKMLKYNNESDENDIAIEDVCASFTKVAIDGLIVRAVEELKLSGLNKIAVAGGVGANSYLRSQLLQLQSQNIQVFLPELKLCTDNAAMIASNGYFQIISGQSSADDTLNATPTLKLRGERPKH
ncbi:MAG: tRNA (adenosine(37)-N6)-threonylcarbamoyltransferase complex transferase subunit TsaD [Clostridia bacterium]